MNEKQEPKIVEVSVVNSPIVLSANNPLKQLKFAETYLAVDGQILQRYTEVQKEWQVSIVPHYMDLSKGVWNVALDSYFFKIKAPADVNTILEVSTSLVTSHETVPGQNRFRPYQTKLGTIHVIGRQGDVNFAPVYPKWFTVERRDTSFQLEISQHPMSIFAVERLEIDFELTFLFQRIK
jgi:hypothetical protein